jgi:hypothetical protein
MFEGRIFLLLFFASFDIKSKEEGRRKKEDGRVNHQESKDEDNQKKTSR